MAKRYGSFTPARAAALRKAQLASAAKRRGQHRRVVAKRVAIGAGVLGATLGAGYGVHRAMGNRLIVSGHSPSVVTKTGTKVVGPHGLRVSTSTKGASITHTGKKGTGFILYQRGVHGTKVKGHPSNPVNIASYKPTKGDFRRMRTYNKPQPGTLQYAREAKQYPVGPTSQMSKKLEQGEVIRRTRSYVQATEKSGKKVTVGHHNAARKFYSNQPRYTGGTVKPLKRMTRRRARRYENRANSIYTGLPVIGSRRRNT